MIIDFSKSKLHPKAFSDQSMQFCQQQVSRELAALLEIVALETGSRRARETWQQAQLRNLLAFAIKRSAFWRGRIKGAKPEETSLTDLPVQTRRDVVAQVSAEGALLKPFDNIGVSLHSTSGSSGTPLQFYHSDMNAAYNIRRSQAQFLMEGRRLDCNFTHCKTLNFRELQSKGKPPGGMTVTFGENWLGPLGHMFRAGRSKQIRFAAARPKGLLKELCRHDIGYLVVSSRILESLLTEGDVGALARAGTNMVLPMSDSMDPTLRRRLADQNIPVCGSYSCEEAGMIGAECPRCPEHYHVAGSNVIVEVDGSELASAGYGLGRILITHLHSYATPFVRYDLGDLGVLADSCPCGYEGPTLSKIIGRSKNLIKQRDGSLTPFMPRAVDLLKLGPYPEYRIRQTGADLLVVEIGGCASLPPELANACEQLIKGLAGQGFRVDVRGVPEINWGQSAKRPLFTNEII